MTTKNNLRAFSASILLEVINDKKSLTHALSTKLSSFTDNRQHALIQELCFGVMRFYFSLKMIAQQFLNSPLKVKDQDIDLLILIGLYQLIYTRVPPHAAIAETVDGCTTFKKPWATKVVNAILRNFERKREETLERLEQDPEFLYAHPHWLINKIKKAWPMDWQAILKANNQYPPMTLRVNSQMVTRDEYLQELAKNDCAGAATQFAPFGIHLNQATAVKNLPRFDQGVVSVQDEASQLVPHLLEMTHHLTLLDACAAPGGKTAAIYEFDPTVEIVALDNDAIRIDRILENQQRSQFKANILLGDATHSEQWWDGKLFDRILLDAPCTATGVIRRHPDIKFLRQPNDLTTAIELQKTLLNSLWPLLKRDGILIYSTCSILPEENDLQIKQFMEFQQDVEVVAIDAKWGRPTQFGRQILPGENAMDGFFYAKLRKV